MRRVFANRRGGHVTLRQEITGQAFANLVRVDAVVLFFRGRNGPQHQRVRHLQRRGMRLQMMRASLPEPLYMNKLNWFGTE
jgi:hypothetical protein